MCYPLVDHLLECVDTAGNDRAVTCSDLLGLVEVMLCQENHLLQVSWHNCENFGQGTWQELQPIIISFLLFLGFLFLFAIHRWQRSNLCVAFTVFTWIHQFFITHRLKNVSAYNCRQKLNIFCIGILPKIVDCDGASSYLKWGGADKFLAQPGRKQATATKLGIYSTYSPRSPIYFLAHCSNFSKPLKKHSEDCPSN